MPSTSNQHFLTDVVLEQDITAEVELALVREGVEVKRVRQRVVGDVSSIDHLGDPLGQVLWDGGGRCEEGVGRQADLPEVQGE